MSFIIPIPKEFVTRARVLASPDDRLRLLREWLGEMLMERAHSLNEEAMTLHSDMEAVLGRLRWNNAEDVHIDDIKTASWHRAKTEFQVIQHVIKLVATLQNEAPAERVAAVVKINDLTGGR